MGRFRRHRRASICRFAVAATALGALLVAPSAWATRGLTKTASVALPPESSRSATATCPVGTHSTAGGFSVTPLGTPGTGFQSVTQVSARRGARPWKVTTGAEGTNPPATMTAHVRCERRRDGRIVVPLTANETVNPGFAQTFDFTCPPQTRPAGAGWSVDDPFNGDLTTTSNLLVIQNRRLDFNTWRVTGLVRNGSNSSDFTVTVVCETITRKRLVQRTAIDAFGDNERASATATCRKRTHVVAGGFVINPLPPGTVPFAPMDYNAPVGNRQWRVDLYDTASGLPPGSSLITYAYCRRNRLRKPRARAGAAVTANGLGPGRVEAMAPVPVG